MKRLERSIEAACVRHAKVLGALSRKMNGLGFVSWPDRVFTQPPWCLNTLTPSVWWVEFKRPGEPLTPLQRSTHRKLKRCRCDVSVFDDVELFKAACRTRWGEPPDAIKKKL